MAELVAKLGHDYEGLSGCGHRRAWTTERLAGQVLISIVCGLQPDRFVGSNRVLARQARACSAVCSNPAEEWLESGRSWRPASEFRAENKSFALGLDESPDSSGP